MKHTSIKKNFAYQMIYEVLVLILPFITSPYIARVIGAEGLGIYSYSYSVAYYFVLFSLLGIKNYGNRAIAQARDDKRQLSETFSNIAALHILISLVCTVAYIGYVVTLKEDQIYAAIQTAYVLSGLFDISWFYFGIEKFKLTVTRNTIIKIVTVICVFTFIHSADDLWKYVCIFAFSSLISQIALWIPLRRYIDFVAPQWNKMKTHFKPLFILFIPAIAVSLYKYMDKIMIGGLSSKTQLGFYENAEKVINIPMTVIASFGTVMLPKMSNLAVSHDEKASKRYISLSMKYVMCLAFALAFGLAGVGTVFAPVFWGDEFELSGTIIMMLAVTIPFIAFANVIRTQYLIPLERDREYLVSVIAGAVINLCINWTLIPSMGAIGAAVGTIAAEVTVCAIQTFVVRKELEIGKYLKYCIPFLLAGLVMFVGVHYLGVCMSRSVLTLVVQILSGAVFYGLFCLAYFYKTRDEVFMKMLFNAKKKLSR